MFEEILQEEIKRVCDQLGPDTKAARLFANCYPNTLETTSKIAEDGTSFVFTGDIPAMWLRDSSAQVRHYLPLARRKKELASFIEGLCRRQTYCILQDSYANAFNETASGKCWSHDETDSIPLDWERKYEVDSLCYPIQLSYLLWKECGCIGQFTEDYHKALEKIIRQWQREQHHENSSYSFIRHNCPPTDTLPNDGKGSPTAYTGMTWSGFRPSDDACRYGYLVPSNMFAVVVLGYAEEILTTIYQDKNLAEEASRLAAQIRDGIERYAKFHDPVFGDVYAYEVDGLGNALFMDDANVPSLLSIPYLGYTTADDPVYQNTRRMILCHANPYYYEGTALKGIGSPHTPTQYVWHIALSMQGLTASDKEEEKRMLDMLTSSDAGTLYMHEGVYVNDPSKFTRPWFAWSNSLFSEFVLHYLEI